MPKHRRTFQERTGFPLKLLEPGYSGELEPPELEVLKTELTKNSKLRKRWGFEEKEPITLKKIKYVAQYGVEEDEQN
tara:strand:- start:251 stop:481 length:231 start_codon:yes stop_codon:yes gene_type:complete